MSSASPEVEPPLLLSVAEKPLENDPSCVFRRFDAAASLADEMMAEAACSADDATDTNCAKDGSGGLACVPEDDSWPPDMCDMEVAGICLGGIDTRDEAAP